MCPALLRSSSYIPTRRYLAAFATVPLLLSLSYYPLATLHSFPTGAIFFTSVTSGRISFHFPFSEQQPGRPEPVEGQGQDGQQDPAHLEAQADAHPPPHPVREPVAPGADGRAEDETSEPGPGFALHVFPPPLHEKPVGEDAG